MSVISIKKYIKSGLINNVERNIKYTSWNTKTLLSFEILTNMSAKKQNHI